MEVDTEEISKSLATQFNTLQLATPLTLSHNWNIRSTGHVTTWCNELAANPVRLIWFELPQLSDGAGGTHDERKQLCNSMLMMQAQLVSGNHLVVTTRSTNEALHHIRLANFLKCVKLQEYHYHWCALATGAGVRLPKSRHFLCELKML